MLRRPLTGKESTSFSRNVVCLPSGSSSSVRTLIGPEKGGYIFTIGNGVYFPHYLYLRRGRSVKLRFHKFHQTCFRRNFSTIKHSGCFVQWNSINLSKNDVHCMHVGVLVICKLVFTVFCVFLLCFLYCFFYVYLFLFVMSVLV